MPNSSFYDSLADPKTIAVRPLSKGMNTVAPSMRLDDGAFIDLQGVEVTERGLVRRNTFHPLLPFAVPFLFDNEHVEEYGMFHLPSGERRSVVITNRALYRLITGTGIYPVYFGRAYVQAGTLGVPTIAGFSFVTDGVKIGDYLDVTVATIRYIVPITNVTALGLSVSGGPISYPDGTALRIIRSFNNPASFVDFTVAKGKLLLVDGTSKGVTAYYGEYATKHKAYHLEDLDDDGDADDEVDTILGASTIDFFGGYVFYGGVIQSDGTHRQRMMWTDVLDTEVVEETSYYDFEDAQGAMLKIASMASLIFVHMEDAVYYGRPANLSGLPYVFTKLETGGAAPVGPKAIVAHSDGQFFVGRDDIYYVSPSSGLTSIGSTIQRTSIRAGKELKRTYLRPDPVRNRLVMGLVPSGRKAFDELYYFNLRTKAWSRDDLLYSRNFTGLSNASAFDPVTWSEMVGTWAAATGSWLSYRSDTTDKLLVGADALGYLHALNDGQDADEWMNAAGREAIAVRVLIETPDFDYEMPDDNKTWHRLGLKITDLHARDETIEFAVQGSTDRGRTWKFLGTMRMEEGDDEDTVSFRLTGSIARFRLESMSVSPEYEINEMTYRVLLRGVEQQRTSGYR